MPKRFIRWSRYEVCYILRDKGNMRRGNGVSRCCQLYTVGFRMIVMMLIPMLMMVFGGRVLMNRKLFPIRAVV